MDVDEPANARARREGRAIGAARGLLGIFVIGVLARTYAGQAAAGDPNPFDFFGYFTNQNSLLAAALLVVAASFGLRGLRLPRWLVWARAIATTNMIVVGVIYNTLVPGTGSAPPWASFVLHVAFPALLVLDWALARARPLPWRSLWLVLPHPVTWLLVVLIRGRTDGWVPYGFLLPERGAASLLLHIVGLLAALIAAGALVWLASRTGLARGSASARGYAGPGTRTPERG
ncbi:Pr6Pr family membrane protein [Gulosibacter sp. 10]|uniref:Pr6Pr family membrane protein n=1 Tax=Gulosibacter sp. 10 TaxID=1255570 RepID=UPI00097F4714|nr:Pr6Pr family membrane protein [Gulosibacter sp. 10]SJM53523.1 Integral membrane protein [Gulosibacter sp. 10]